MAIGRIPEPGTGIPESIIAAKGDLIVGTANDTPGILSVGTNGHTLVADSSVSPTGLKWAVDPVADVITTAGDLIYGTAADTVARLGIGTAGQVLKVNSGATAPEWGAAPAAASGPAFKATGSGNQGLSASTFTKAELGTETFDTDSCYDPTTNYRFTPNKAGYYSFQTTVRITHGDASAYYQYGIYKNGTLENLLIIVTAQTSGSTYAASNLIYFNGTTDYAELYVYTQATASQNLDKGNTFFSGVWIRS